MNVLRVLDNTQDSIQLTPCWDLLATSPLEQYQRYHKLRKNKWSSNRNSNQNLLKIKLDLFAIRDLIKSQESVIIACSARTRYVISTRRSERKWIIQNWDVVMHVIERWLKTVLDAVTKAKYSAYKKFFKEKPRKFQMHTKNPFKLQHQKIVNKNY